MNTRFLRRSVFLSFLAILAQQVLAAEGSNAPLKEGEAVYKEVCSACHATGVAHAPKFQDREAWAPLLEEGQAVLTGHAWVGVRAMPARGGVPELKLIEFARAVAYMARNAGGDWKDPDAPTMRRIAGEAEKRLDVAIRESQAMKRELHRLNLQRK